MSIATVYYIEMVLAAISHRVIGACMQERLRRESLEREKQIEQDRLNSKINEEKKQEVCIVLYWLASRDENGQVDVWR